MVHPQDLSEAVKLIHEIVRLGDVQTTVHCRMRMRERNIDFQDLLSVLLTGEIKELPEYDERYDQQKYKVEGTTIDGDSAIAVTVILSFRAVLVVTIFGGDDFEPR